MHSTVGVFVVVAPVTVIVVVVLVFALTDGQSKVVDALIIDWIAVPLPPSVVAPPTRNFPAVPLPMLNPYSADGSIITEYPFS